SGPTHGSLNGPDGSGHFTYTPTGTYYGADSFTFHVTSSISGLSSGDAVVNISVEAPVAPSVSGGNFTTPFATQLSNSVTFSNTTAGTLSVNVSTPPANGVVPGPDASGTFTYTSPAGCPCGDSSIYVITSMRGTSCSDATVSITVEAPAAPSASGGDFTTPFATQLSDSVTFGNVSVGPLSVNITTPPANGV